MTELGENTNKEILLNRAASIEKSNSSIDHSDLKIILTTDFLENALQGKNIFFNFKIKNKKIKEHQEQSFDPKLSVYENKYKKFRVIRKIFFFFYLSLLIFQKPIWCDRNSEFLVFFIILI